MRRILILCCIAAPAFAEPPLEEFAGGAIPDDVRAAMRDALVEEVDLLGGKALAPRPAGIAKLKMEEVARRFPQSAAAQRTLGRAAYATGDVTAAEIACKAAVDLSSGAPWALGQLADFYADRNDAKSELAALDRLAEAQRAAATTPDGKNELRTTWRRARETAAAHAGVPGVADPAKYDRLIVELSPDDPSWLRRYIDGLLADGKPARAIAEAARYKKLFPTEVRYFAQVEAQVAEGRRDADKAEAVYRTLLGKTPAPTGLGARDVDGLYDDFLDLLQRSGRLREVRRALAAKARAGRLSGFDLALDVHLLLHGGDRDAARKVLDDAAKSDAATGELLLRARLYTSLGAPAAAVPLLYEAFRKSQGPKEKEESLGELGLSLLTGDVGRTGLTPLGPLDGFRLRHVASGPSVAGGLASLLFNGVGRRAAADLDRAEAAYGNGERAQAVLAELKKAAPKSPWTAAVLRGLVDFRRAYKDQSEAARLADEFGRAFPKDAQFFAVMRTGCDARWKAASPEAGAACYQRLLDEARRRGDSREYDTTLNELGSAWEQAGRTVEIVRVFWTEIGKHPDDATLYDRFLEHTARHNLFDEELKVYQQASQRFPSASWFDRLARWHLRHRGEQAFRQITEQLASTVEDPVLAEALEGLVEYRHDRPDTQAFYEAIYKKALDRFPFDLRFVRKLVAFYDREGGHGGEALAKRYSFFDAELRARVVRDLAAAGRLDATVATLGARRVPGVEQPALAGLPGNVAERQLAATALIHLSRQEEAEPILAAVCTDFPGDVPLARRHAALYRAVGKPSRRLAAEKAAALLDGLTKLFPADEALVTEEGDYLSEAGEGDEAAKRYERIVAMRPGDPEAFLRLATIDWDYFRFDDAAAAIGRARKKAGDPLRFADKLAAVYESRKDFPPAIAEYVRILVAAQKLDAQPAATPGDEMRRDDEGEGEFDGRGDGGGGDPASIALDRLATLRARRQLGPAIDKAFRAQAAAGDGRAVLAFAEWLARIDDGKGRRALLTDAATKTTDPRLLERIAAEARNDPDGRGLLIAALARESTLGKGAPGYVIALVDALVDAHRDAEAERELSALVARLDAGGEDDREDAVDARVAFADFLWRRQRWDEALAQRAAAADHATGERRTTLRLEVIGWQIERGRTDEAEKAARVLVDASPGEPRFARPVAEAMWRRGQRDEALAFLAAQITAAKKRDLSDETKRAMVAELRHAVIERATEAGRFREAVDEWIEIVNRRPDDRGEIAALQAFASEHALVPRVVGTYEKTAQASSRDVRWPIVLAVLADLGGDPKTAAQRLGEALRISPDRKDLHRERAEAFARAGDPASAAAAYHRLWELSDKDPQWAVAEGRMLARAGRRAEAVAAVRRLVDADPPEPSQWARAAQVLEQAGLLDDAWPLAQKVLEKAGRDLRGRSLAREEAATFARLAVRTGRAAEAWAPLASLEEQAHDEAGAEGNPEPWRASTTADACHDALDDALPKAVALYATDADARRYLDQVREHAQGDEIDRMAQVAAAAGRPDVGRDLLRRTIARGGSVAENTAARVLRELEDAGQWGEMIKVVDEDRLGDPPSLLAKARACRALADPCEEEALHRYVDTHSSYIDPLSARFGEPDPAVDRYLTLLVERHRDDELERLARRGTFNAGQIADFLLAHGKVDLGMQAILSAGSSETSAWRSAKQAGALLALDANGDGAKALLAQILAPAPIGQAIGHRPDEEKEVVGRRWYRYAERYGDAIARAAKDGAGLAEARRFSAAAVEDRPLDPAAYVAQGDALERTADHGRAEAAYEHALVLAPADARAIDRLAKAHLATGDRKGALAAWDRVLGKPPTARSRRARFDLVLAAGLPEEARRPFAESLVAGWRTEERLGDLAALAAAYPSHAAGSEWERLLRALLDRSGWHDLPLLSAMAGRTASPDDALLDRAAWEPTLRVGATIAPDGAAWLQALSAWGLAERHFDATLFAAAEAEKAAAGAPAPSWVALDRARARAGKGDVAGAATELAAWSARPEGDRAAAADVLHALGSPLEWDVRIAAWKQRRAEAHTAGDEAAYAEALLHEDHRDEAIAVLRGLAVRGLDDAEAIGIAAATAERWKLAAVARDLRRSLAAIRPRDGINRAALARDERDAGDPAAAVSTAAQVLADRGVESSARREAGRLLGEMARAKAAGASQAIAAAAGRPLDEPLALARFFASDDPRPLGEALGSLYAPRASLAVVIERAAREGRHAEAAASLRRLRALGLDGSGLAPERAALLAVVEERAAGHPVAALAAVDDTGADRYAASVAEGPARLPRPVERALAQSIAERRAQLAAWPAGDGPKLAEAAVAAATDAHDTARLAFWTAVAAALSPSESTTRRARDARAAADGDRRRDGRRFVTASIDDLVEPAPLASGGQR